MSVIFTPEVWEAACYRALQGASCQQIAEEFGLTTDQVYNRFVGQRAAGKWKHQGPRRYTEARASRPGRPQNYTSGSKVTPGQIEDRDRRAQGYDARDFTSSFFGDPPRGFSALDKRKVTA